MKTVMLSPAGVILLCLLPLPFHHAAANEAKAEKQVLVTAKFVEIKQTDAEELGFDWLLGGVSRGGDFSAGGTGGTATGGGVSSGDYPFVPPDGGTVTGRQPPTGGLDQGIDTSYRFPIDSPAGGTGTPGTFGVAGVFTDPQFQVIIRALQQRQGVDLLSAPSVITRSGQRAKIEIVRDEVIYPVEFDTLEQPEGFFSAGETLFGIGMGAAFGDLHQYHTTTNTVQSTRIVNRTETKQIQIGAERQFIGGVWVDVPVYRNREVTVRERQTFSERVRERKIEGIMNENSPKMALDFTHFISNNIGVGGQFEWIQGNLSNAFMGQVKVTGRAPIELPRMGIAPYSSLGLGVLSGDGINSAVGSVAAGLEARLQRGVGPYLEYSHNFAGNGMDFGQILGGIRIVINDLGGKPGSSRLPTGFTGRETGVTLEVEPTVSDDGQTIDLKLAPEVVEFEGFINYGSPITGAGGTGLPGAMTLTESRILKPVFSNRKSSTQVTIGDGQTVALGGLVSEGDPDVKKKKIPFLGNLPIVGRLFQNNSERHPKKNLVIFVTAVMKVPEE